MYWSLRISYLLTLLLAIPTSGLLVRIFIIQHDCGHGSFFVNQRANDLVGMLCSVFTLTPYANWRRQHAGHHVNWNNLDQRKSGSDIYSSCLTVKEYLALTRRQRLLYRLPRHPVFAHILLPPLIFLLLYRVPFDTPRTWYRERRAVYSTNLALVALIAVLGTFVGFRAVLLVQLPIMVVTSIIGVGLFAVQHRFSESLWMRRPEWRHSKAALEGSSYFKLPKILQWFTGNIGFHSVHHLSTRIPNYRLEACYHAHAAFQAARPLSLSEAMNSIRLALWDEDGCRLVSFRDVARMTTSEARKSGPGFHHILVKQRG